MPPVREWDSEMAITMSSLTWRAATHTIGNRVCGINHDIEDNLIQIARARLADQRPRVAIARRPQRGQPIVLPTRHAWSSPTARSGHRDDNGHSDAFR